MTDYLVDPILPLGAIHLVAGQTGAGKTRWLLEAMLACMKNQKVLRCPSLAQPWLYISGDRQEAEVWETVDSLGISRADIPLLPAFAPLKTPQTIFEEAETQGKNLLVWEGFGGYLGDRAGGNAVKSWLSSVIYMLRHDKFGQLRTVPMTIIGVMEQPKMRPRDQYPNPRQRVSGPAAWGHSSSTIILIEYADKRCQGPLRTIGVYPRNSQDFIANATLETGHFVII